MSGQRAQCQGKKGKTNYQTGDNSKRAPLPARNPRRQHYRENWEDAGCENGRNSGEEGKEDEYKHARKLGRHCIHQEWQSLALCQYHQCAQKLSDG